MHFELAFGGLRRTCTLKNHLESFALSPLTSPRMAAGFLAFVWMVYWSNQTVMLVSFVTRKSKAQAITGPKG